MRVPASITNKLDRLALQNELEQEFIINSRENKLTPVFNVVVLSGSPHNTNNPNIGTAYGNESRNNDQEPSYYFVRVRRLDVDEFEKPDPFLAKTFQLAKKIVNMHPIGVLLNSEGQRPPSQGDIYSCRYLTKDRKGIVLLNLEGVSKKFLSLAGKSSLFQAAALGWSGETVGNYVSQDLANVPTRVSNGIESPGALNFTWEQLVTLAKTNLFEPLLYNIRQHECSMGACADKYFNGNQWDAFNYGDSGSSMGKTRLLSQPLSQFNIAQVRSMQDNNQSNLGGKQIFASGAYQIVPETFKSMIKKINGINTAFLYNKENQNALGIYLVTRKRSKLGKYLFGMNDRATDAGNQLALEFASIRVQSTMTRSDGVVVQQYQRYYGGVGVNQFGGIDAADAQQSMAAINAVRANIDNSQLALQMRDEVIK